MANKKEIQSGVNKMVKYESFTPNSPSNLSCRGEYITNTNYLHLDEGESVTFPDNPAFLNFASTGFSVSFNYNYQNLNDFAVRTLLSKGAEGDPGEYTGWSFYIINDEIFFQIMVENVNSTVSIPAQSPNSWHNLSVVVSGRDVSQWQFYVDGKKEVQTNHSNGLEDNTVAAWTGNTTSLLTINDTFLPTAVQYNDKIDNIYIWTRKTLTKCHTRLLGDKLRNNKMLNETATLNADLFNGMSFQLNFDQDCAGLGGAVQEQLTGTLGTFVGGADCTDVVAY